LTVWSITAPLPTSVTDFSSSEESPLLKRLFLGALVPELGVNDGPEVVEDRVSINPAFFACAEVSPPTIAGKVRLWRLNSTRVFENGCDNAGEGSIVLLVLRFSYENFDTIPSRGPRKEPSMR
jgi:hypothetical protein